MVTAVFAMPTSWLLRGLLVMALSFGLFVILCSLFVTGKEKFSTPSLSIRAAKWNRAFIRQMIVSQIEKVETEHKLPVKEAWLEYQFERYKSIPINKRKSGVQLCVRFDDPGEVLSDYFGRIAEVIPNVTVKDNGKTCSGNIVVFSFLATDSSDFPSKGRFVIQSGFRDHVKVYATYEFMPYESDKVKKSKDEKNE